jgi:site-specific DNA recombinase
LLAEAFTVSRRHLQEEISYINTTHEEIIRLLEDDFLELDVQEMIQQSFYNFSETELRVFFLMYFDEVAIDFEKQNEIQISYRLSPFISLENTTGQLTENNNKKENLTG